MNTRIFFMNTKAAFIAALVLIQVLLFSYSATAQEADVRNFVDNKRGFNAKDAGWRKGGFANLNFSNVGLSYWAAGGQSSMSVTLIANGFLIYRDSQQVWETFFDGAWGNIRNGGRTLPSGERNPFFKNEDKLIVLSKYGRQINDKLNYTALIEFKSQFVPGYAPFDPNIGNRGQHISNILAPAFGLVSLGFDYRPKPPISIYASPATGKFTVVRESRLADMGAFGVQEAERDADNNPIPGTGQKFRPEIGWYVNLMYTGDVMENVNLRTRLDLFTNYATPLLTDINWEVNLNMKVNKYITASVFTHLIYDDDIDVIPERPERNPRIQFKHVIGIGLSYKFGDRM